MTGETGDSASSSTTQDKQHEQGFSLIETLVAFVIVSFGLVSLYSSLGTHYKHWAQADLTQRTLAHAVSHLDMLGVATELLPGMTTGTYASGAHWQLEVTQIPLTSSTTQAPVRAHAVVLSAFDRRGHQLVQLKTFSLAKVPR